MKYLMIALCLTGSVFSSAQSRILEGNMMAGGTAIFTSSSYSNSKASSINISFQPAVGYFLTNQVAGGMAVSFERRTGIVDFGDKSANSIFLTSPFVRGYFLSSKSKFNLFAQVQYGVGGIWRTDTFGNTSSAALNAYSLSAGPAIFLNPFVALEFAVNYSSLGGDAFNNQFRENTTAVSVGFQVHFDGDH